MYAGQLVYCANGIGNAALNHFSKLNGERSIRYPVLGKLVCTMKTLGQAGQHVCALITVRYLICLQPRGEDYPSSEAPDPGVSKSEIATRMQDASKLNGAGNEVLELDSSFQCEGLEFNSSVRLTQRANPRSSGISISYEDANAARI